jgi:hypothetical protein
MLKISSTLVAVTALSATLLAGGMAWATSTHASVKGSATSPRTIKVVVPAKDSNWTNTGVTLQAHHALDIRARGIVNYGLGLFTQVVNPWPTSVAPTSAGRVVTHSQRRS